MLTTIINIITSQPRGPYLPLSRGGRLVALVGVYIVWNLEPLASGSQSSPKLIPHIICQFLCARGKNWTRTYSTRDQVPTCPVFTRAKIKSRFGILKNLPSHIDSWKFSMLLLYILWDDWPIFMISGSNEQLQQELEYTLLKPDYPSWWISKMPSGCEDTLERYAIKFCFKLGKNATETYGMLQTTFRPSSISFWVV